jgi:hypothetical protein
MGNQVDRLHSAGKFAERTGQPRANPFRMRFSGGPFVPVQLARCLAATLLIVCANAPAGAAPAGTLREKIYGAFANVKSYKLTVLGSVRSLGIWVAPDKYQMTTDFDGKPVRTIIIGKDFWTHSDDGKWEKSGTASNNLDVDIAGLLRNAKANPGAPFVKQPDQTQDGKRVGTFAYTFKDGTEESCNFNPATYLVTRCKADQLTLLYSGYNDPTNKVETPK